MNRLDKKGIEKFIKKLFYSFLICIKKSYFSIEFTFNACYKNCP